MITTKQTIQLLDDIRDNVKKRGKPNKLSSGEHVHYMQGKNAICNTGAWNILYTEKPTLVTCRQCLTKLEKQ